MAINLEKGQAQELPAPVYTIGLGWDSNSSAGGPDFDLDAAVLMLDKRSKLPSDRHLIFYNNTKSGDGSVIYSGDNRTGEGKGDNETIRLDLSKADHEISEILVLVMIHKGLERGQSFGQVPNSYIRINDATDDELARSQLNLEFAGESIVEFARFRKEQGSWKFILSEKSVASGFKNYLKQFR